MLKGSAISSTISMGVTYCACASASSLCSACLGRTSPHTTGRRRSVLLLAASVLLALVFQYSLAPAITGDGGSGWWRTVRKTPGAGRHVYGAWTDGCEGYRPTGDGGLAGSPFETCAGNAAAYRPTSLAFVFFAVASAATYHRPLLNREVWPAKFSVYLLLVLASVFVSNKPWFSGLFLHLGRVGAMVFVVVQSVIVIDLAYNWNDAWVAKADRADRESFGQGKGWLQATIAVCFAFYSLAFAGIGMLYSWFGGCGSNDAIITMTLIGIVGVTAVQLSGVDGSLLTSSAMSLYAVYLAYSAVSKNPNSVCNPQLGSESNPLDIAMGLALTALSLAWMGWSYTAEDRLTADNAARPRSLGSDGNSFRRGQDALLDLDDPFLEYDDGDRPPAGLALSTEEGEDYLTTHSSDVWKLNAILALVSCWVAMTLTGWGSISGGGMSGDTGAEEHTAANPTVGKANMAVIAVGQWVALSLYAWTLLAPRLFPGRDFS